MRAPVPLQLRRFTAVPYSLSDSHPIALRHSVYMQPRDDIYDMHYELEFGIVVRGTKVRQYMDQEVTLEQGQVWFHPALEPHGCAIVEPPCELLVFILQPEFVMRASSRGRDWSRPFHLPPARRPRCQADARPDLLRIARRLAEYVREGRRDVEQWAEVLLFEALLTVGDETDAAEQPAGGAEDAASFGTAPSSPGAQSSLLVQPALSLVYSSRAHVDVMDAARACNMSVHPFSARFEKLMGVPFSRFARMHRLKGAAAQLSATEDPLKLVSAEWGFRDVSHLTKSFTATFGKTPGEYRRAAQHANQYRTTAPDTSRENTYPLDGSTFHNL